MLRQLIIHTGASQYIRLSWKSSFISVIQIKLWNLCIKYIQCTQTEVVYAFGSLVYCICTRYLVGAPFALITASIRCGMEVISLWHCWGGMEAQVSLTVAFSLSAYFGLLFLIFLLTISHRFSLGFRSGEFAGQSSTPTAFNQLWCFWQCGQVPNPAGKWNQHL